MLDLGGHRLFTLFKEPDANRMEYNKERMQALLKDNINEHLSFPPQLTTGDREYLELFATNIGLKCQIIGNGNLQSLNKYNDNNK